MNKKNTQQKSQTFKYIFALLNWRGLLFCDTNVVTNAIFRMKFEYSKHLVESIECVMAHTRSPAHRKKNYNLNERCAVVVDFTWILIINGVCHFYVLIAVCALAGCSLKSTHYSNVRNGSFLLLSRQIFQFAWLFASLVCKILYATDNKNNYHKYANQRYIC